MKNIKKRLLSIFLAASMVLGIFPGMTSPVRAADLPGEEQHGHLPVYNNYILSKIMDQYVRSGTNDDRRKLTPSLGSLYYYHDKTSENAAYRYGIGHNPENYAMFYQTDIWRREGKEWYTKWYPSSDRHPSWLNGEYIKYDHTKMRFGADFHKYGDSDPYMTIDGKGILGSSVKNNSVDRKSAEIPLNIDKPIIIGGNGKGNKSEVRAPWIVLVDNTPPMIESAYKHGKSTIVLQANERLRSATGGAGFHNMILNINIADSRSGKEIGKRTAKYSGHGGRNVYFDIQGDLTNQEFQVTRITGVSYNYDSYDFDVYGIMEAYNDRSWYDPYKNEFGYTKYNNAIKKLTTLEKAVDSPVTDPAGNGLKIRTMDLTPFNLVVDTVAPKITGVELTGDMITPISTLDREDWPKDIDRSSVFAGVGEELYFTIKTDEKIGTDTWMNHMTLNVKRKSATGNVSIRKAEGDNFTYGPLIIEEGMISTDDLPIHPMGITIGVSDNAGNSLDLTNLWQVTPDQKIYLDSTAPNFAAESITESQKRDLTIRLDFNDNSEETVTSGLLGLNADIALVGNSSPITTFKYALSDIPESPFIEGYTGKAIDKRYTGTGQIGGGSEPIWTTMPIYNYTRYLHIKFEGEEKSLTISDLSLKVRMKDWAGNMMDKSVAVESYALDETPPVISLNSMKPIYDNQTATVYSEVKITDINKEGLLFWYNWDTDHEQEGTLLDSIGKMDKFYNKNDAFISKINIRAKDAQQNESMAEYSVQVDLTKPKIDYAVNSNLNLPNAKPDITVTGSVYGDKTAYTRITMSRDDNTHKYIRVVNTGDTRDLFDFTEKLLVRKINGDIYTNTGVLNDYMETYYGPVTIELEAAYDTDLNPGYGSKSDGTNVTNGSYIKSNDALMVKYAPLRKDLHNISELRYTDASGEILDVVTMYGTNHILFNQSMTASRISFDISNNLRPEWGMQDVDFDQSYIALVKEEEDKTMTEVLKSQLSNSSGQTFTIPSLDKDGNPFTSGLYKLKVCVVQRDGDIDKAVKAESMWLLLDDIQPQNPGIWRYTHQQNFINLFNYSLPFDDITKIAEGKPFSSLNISFKNREETERNDLYSIESIGVMNSTIFIGIDELETKFLNRTVGKVEGMRVWNAKCTGWEDLTFNEVSRYDYYGIGDKVSQKHIINKESIDETLEGKTADGNIRVTFGINTIRYQIKMQNGMLSPIYELEINISDQAPIMGLSVVGEHSKLDDGQGPNKKINKADLQINKAFSNNGDIKTYFLSKNTYFKINGEEKVLGINTKFDLEDFYPYSLGNPDPDIEPENAADIITIVGTSYNGYQNYSEGTDIINSKKNAHNIFVAVDEAGGITLLIPQFRDQPYATENGIDTYTRYRLEHEILEWSYFKSHPQSKYSSRDYFEFKGTPKNLIPSESTVTFKGEGLPDEGITLPVENPPIPNAAGYMGSFFASWMDDHLTFEITSPTIDDSHDTNIPVNRQFTLNAVGRAGDKYEYTDTMTGMKYLDLLATTSVFIDKNKPGVSLFFYTDVSVNGGGYNDCTTLPIFTNGSYSVNLRDSYGVDHKYDFVVNFPEFAAGLKISFSTMEPTTRPVTVTFLSEVTGNISVTGEDGKAVITGNGTTMVEALVSENSNLTVNWGEGQSRTIPVGNIGSLSPRVAWSYLDEDVVDGQLVGSATAVIVDNNWSLVDSVTRELPEYTFYPGGETSHTFSVVNGEEGTIPINITATLPVILIEPAATPDADLDNTMPSMQILAYSAASDKSMLTDQKKSLWLHDPATQWKNFDLMNYTGYTKYLNSSDFLTNLGWGHRYRLHVETSDQSRVKLIIKNGLYAKNPKYTDNSDTVPGVTLSGNALDIVRNTAFTLFAVDSADNSTAVNMDVNNVGAAPIPKLVKTFPSISSVRVYLLPGNEEEAFTDLMLTDGDAKLETEGIYDGRWYMDLNENRVFTLRYSYKYQEKLTEGTLDVKITEIDTKLPEQLGSTTWSANKILEATNQDVIAQLEFDKIINKVTANIIEGLEIIVNGSRISVKYKENKGQVTLTCTPANGKSMVIVLDKVDNIDKTSPTISATDPSIAINGRSAIVKFDANEYVAFQEGRKQGTSFNHTITENGKYTYHFTDKAGNMTTKNVEITDLVLEPLILKFSTSSDGIDPKKYPSELGQLSNGDTIYVSANRKCNITFNNGEKTEYTSGWIGFTISEDEAGLYPSIHAVDRYGNAALGQLSQIALIDKKAPIITLKYNTLNVEFGTDENDLRAILMENAIVFDAVDKNPTIEITFTMPESPMVVPVTYTAMDKAGNKSEFKGFMRLTDGTEAQVYVNGELLEQDGIFLADPGKLKLTVNLRTAEPYSVSYKNGIKTAGQMKIGVTDIVRNRTNANEMELPFDKEGYYTVSIVTQGREYFRFLIYIK